MSRLCPHLLACAVLGVLSTFALAWTLGGLLPWREPAICGTYLSPRESASASVHVWQAMQAGALRRSIGTYATPLWNNAPMELPVQTSSTHIALDSEIDTTWGRLREALSPDATQVAAVEEARGWPCLALWCWRDSQFTTPAATGGGFFLDVDPFGGPPWRVLPYMPIWRGLLADSGLYAAAWAGILIVPRVVRRRVRLRRSRCPECGYDLRATGGAAAGCPECGWNRGAFVRPGATPPE